VDSGQRRIFERALKRKLGERLEPAMESPKDNPHAVQQVEKPIFHKLLDFVEHPLFLWAFGIVCGLIGMIAYTPVLFLCGLSVILAFHRAKVVLGLAWPTQTFSYALLLFLTSGGLYETGRTIKNSIHIPTAKEIVDLWKQENPPSRPAPDSGGRETPHGIAEPRLYLQPDSTFRNDDGSFSLELLNSGPDIEYVGIHIDYFVAQKTEGNILVNRVFQGGWAPDDRVPPLRTNQTKLIVLDFNSWKGSIQGTDPSQSLSLILRTYEYLHHKYPVLLGARIITTFRRYADGKYYKRIWAYAAGAETKEKGQTTFNLIYSVDSPLNYRWIKRRNAFPYTRSVFLCQVSDSPVGSHFFSTRFCFGGSSKRGRPRGDVETAGRFEAREPTLLFTFRKVETRRFALRGRNLLGTFCY
jgi:hypothetical protein